MLRLTINGIAVEVAPGATLLEAAELAGIAIPTLCHAEGLRPLNACMICAVEETNTRRTLPACSAKAEAGMAIETDTPALRDARRAVLELLLSEHAGDCEAPCRRMCPAGMNVPLMLRRIAQGDFEEAGRIALAELALPATLGWVCSAPCEVGCRRGAQDEAVAIRDLHRQAGEALLSSEASSLPYVPDTGKRVAVVGGGPAGLAAAWVVRRHGHACHVYEKAAQVGGILRALPEDRLPKAILDAEICVLESAGIEFHLECSVGERLPLEELDQKYDAVILACKRLSGTQQGRFLAEGHRLVIRDVASGKAAAEAAHRFLMPDAPPRPELYDSTLGRVGREQIAAYAENRIDPGSLARPRQPQQTREEAARCLHCDCHAPLSCKLRQYATEYGARPTMFRKAERPPAQGLQRNGGVLFEPGKCIKCGLCVEITRQLNEELGLTFVGRGFNMEVRVPFNGLLEDALKRCAQACVKACPTGALTLAEQEERAL